MQAIYNIEFKSKCLFVFGGISACDCTYKREGQGTQGKGGGKKDHADKHGSYFQYSMNLVFHASKCPLEEQKSSGPHIYQADSLTIDLIHPTAFTKKCGLCSYTVLSKTVLIWYFFS